MVVKRGTNEHEILPMARHFRGTRHRAALHRVHGRRRHQRLAHGRGDALGRSRAAASPRNCRWCSWSPRAPGETAERWGYADGSGEIGVISSVTQAFCGDCNRARLSTEGKLYLCLFATQGHDLRALLRGGASDDRTGLRHRPHLAGPRRPLFGAARHACRPTTATGGRRVEMSYIGG